MMTSTESQFAHFRWWPQRRTPILSLASLSSLLVIGLTSCAPSSSAATYTGRTVQALPGSSRKICQLTGDVDLETGLPTVNHTFTAAQVWGTDLGFPFAYDGAGVPSIGFFFGDTWRGPTQPAGSDGDSLAFTTDTKPCCV
jgi:hypothetical protein